MSKVTVKINKIKNKLDNISGLDGNFVNNELDWVEMSVNLAVKNINKHLKKDRKNGTIFE